MYLFLKNVAEISRTRIKNLILDKRLKINGKINNFPSKKVNEGDNIFLKFLIQKKLH